MSFENWTIEDLFTRCMDCDDMTLGMDREEFAALRRKIAELQNHRAALQSGNSGRLNNANSFTDDELMGMAHGDNPVANAYRELLEFRRNAAGGNSGQPVTVPAGYVLVPVEPTVEMTEALWDEINESRDMNNAYRAMLAAAPKGV